MIPVSIHGLEGNPFAWCLSFSQDSNTIWMGAQPGIYAINQATRTAVYHNPPVMQNRTVRQIVEDKFGRALQGAAHDLRGQRQAIFGDRVRRGRVSQAPERQHAGAQGSAQRDRAVRVRAIE